MSTSTPTLRTRCVTVTALAAILWLGGCSSSGGDSPAAASSLAQFFNAAGEYTDAEAQCFGTATIEAFGAETVTEWGFTADQVGQFPLDSFTDEQRLQLARAVGGCVDLEAAYAETWTEDFGSDVATCMTETLTEQEEIEMYAFTLRVGLGAFANTDAYSDAYATCSALPS